MSLFLVCLALAGRPADPPTVVRVVTADGKPVAGAKAWVFDMLGEGAKEPEPRLTDADGKLTISTKDSPQLFVRDDAGRVGEAWLNARRTDQDTKGVEVVLVETVARSGRVTGPDGKPVAGAVVTPEGYQSANRTRRTARGPSDSIPLPKWEHARLAVKTDADGAFRFPVPVGYSVYFRVKAEAFGSSKWNTPAGTEPGVQLAAPGAVTITLGGIDPALLKGRGWRLQGEHLDKPKATYPRRFEMGSFNGTATVTVKDVIPGKYRLDVYGDGGKTPGVFVPPPAVEVESGKSVGVSAKFGPSATVTGKVTDKDGKGVGKVPILVNIADAEDGPQPRSSLWGETAADGTYTLHGPAGWYTVWTQTPLPDGYAAPSPRDRQRRQVEPAKMEVGKSHTFAPIALQQAVTFTAAVTLADGKPAAGASVECGLTLEYRRDKIVTDKGGKFTLPNMSPDDAVAPRVRLSTAVNVPETFAFEKHERPAAIELNEANGATFTGRVTDTRGKPISGAKVALRHQVPHVGRNAGLYTFGAIATTTTDAAGKYTFAGYWPKDVYRTTATADGYADAETKQRTAVAGQTHDLGDIQLARAGLSASGVVVVPDGTPVPGAEVFCLDAGERIEVASAADGSFALKGFGEGGGFVLVKKVGYRLAAVPVNPAADAKKVVVTLSKLGTPAAPVVIPPEHRAALDDLTRHVLKLVWESHADHGYGGNAISSLAQIDPATAKKWNADEKVRTAGKTDFSHLILRAERETSLFETAKTDPDEALAVLGGVKPLDAFGEATRLAEFFLPTDKAKALRFAEEAVVKARQRDLPDRMYALAEAGDLAVRCGGAGGRKVLDEAAALAAKLTPGENDRNSLAIGLVAAHLAPHDPAKGEALLDRLKPFSDYNRFLAASIARVARTDLPRAKAMMVKFKPDNASYPQTARVRAAYAVAATQPDEAVKLVDDVRDMRYRVGGYLGLASRFVKTDKARAHKLIDVSFELLEADPDAMRSWSNFGGRAGLAASVAVRAAEVGHPDVAHLVARCLALRSVEDGRRAEYRDERAVGLAATLAHIDPATARHLLATVAPPEEFVRRALNQQRDWLFALALAEPVRAKELADKLIAQAKDVRGGRNGLSHTGLVELSSMLTTKDRVREFGRYGRQFGDILEWD